MRPGRPLSVVVFVVVLVGLRMGVTESLPPPGPNPKSSKNGSEDFEGLLLDWRREVRIWLGTWKREDELLCGGEDDRW